MRALLVDDEGSLLVTLAANLELAGFEVVEADDPRRALALIEDQPFDLVLSDIRMPGMNGVELFRAIRRIRPELPVVLMTGFALETLIEEAIQEGVFTVLPKPFSIDHLVAALSLAARRPAVLVVEPRAGGESLGESLRAVGVRCHVGSNEAEAVEAVSEEEVDVCLLDVFDEPIPRLMERIQAIRPLVAFIAIAARDETTLLRAALERGAFGCLQKPVDMASVVALLAKARGRPELARYVGGGPW